ALSFSSRLSSGRQTIKYSFGIHSFANSTLATANHLGRKGAIELRSLIRKRTQTNQLPTKLLTSGPGGRRFKSSLPDHLFSRTFSRLRCFCGFRLILFFRYIRYNKLPPNFDPKEVDKFLRGASSPPTALHNNPLPPPTP